jgi:chloramphenicol-sensitive protein RarD
MPPPPARPHNTGLALAVTAYLVWGFMPLYFKPLEGRVDVGLILSHRILWSIAILLLLVSALRLWPTVLDIFRSPRTLGTLALTTLLLSVNWFTFTWTVTHQQAVQSALGYFLNPLFSAMLAMVFLGERFRPLQWIALAIATAGVTVLAIGSGTFPTAAVVLACTWGTYGLLRKLAPVDAIVGLTVETLLLIPIVVAYLYYAAIHTLPGYAPPAGLLGYLSLAGLLTTIPLLCFARAAKLLKLSTLGFLQYIGPSCQLLCAVLVFGEPFTPIRQLTFALIWTAVALFLLDALRHNYFPRQIIEEPT